MLIVVCNLFNFWRLTSSACWQRHVSLQMLVGFSQLKQLQCNFTPLNLSHGFILISHTIKYHSNFKMRKKSFFVFFLKSKKKLIWLYFPSYPLRSPDIWSGVPVQAYKIAQYIVECIKLAPPLEPAAHMLLTHCFCHADNLMMSYMIKYQPEEPCQGFHLNTESHSAANTSVFSLLQLRFSCRTFECLWMYLNTYFCSRSATSFRQY